jgi:hypothetical protein
MVYFSPSLDSQHLFLHIFAFGFFVSAGPWVRHKILFHTVDKIRGVREVKIFFFLSQLRTRDSDLKSHLAYIRSRE